MKAAKKSVGKSVFWGTYEIELPPELKTQIQARRQTK